VDEGGNIHSREFLLEELILDDAEDLANVQKRESSHVKVERLKPGTTDVVNLIPRSDQTPREIVLPVPKSGARPLDVRISSDVAPDLLTKEQQIQLSDIVHVDKRIIVNIHNGAGVNDATSIAHDHNSEPTSTKSFSAATCEVVFIVHHLQQEFVYFSAVVASMYER
jgi:hypothetical protein